MGGFGHAIDIYTGYIVYISKPISLPIQKTQPFYLFQSLRSDSRKTGRRRHLQAVEFILIILRPDLSRLQLSHRSICLLFHNQLSLIISSINFLLSNCAPIIHHIAYSKAWPLTNRRNGRKQTPAIMVAPSNASFGTPSLDLFYRKSRPVLGIELEGQKEGFVSAYSTLDKIRGVVTVTSEFDMSFDDISITFEGTMIAFPHFGRNC